MMQITQRVETSVSRAGGLVMVVGLALVLGVLAPSSATAQLPVPNIMAPKQAAQRAAAASNTQTAAMQNVNGNPTASAPAPTASQPSRRPPEPIKAAAPTDGPVKSTTAAGPAAAAGEKNATVSLSSKPAAGAKPSTVAAKGAAPEASKITAVVSAPAGPATPASGGDSAGSISVTERGVKGEVSLNREVFSYDAGDRRDPFISLMRSGDLRPMLSDLRLTTVLYDATGQNSIAVMRDQSTKDQYRVRVGMTLGRMRVAQIQPKQVVFTIEEVGFSRQEALALGDTTKARTP
jgi:cytoskeletal protein RodZ